MHISFKEATCLIYSYIVQVQRDLDQHTDKHSPKTLSPYSNLKNKKKKEEKLKSNGVKSKKVKK